MKYILMEDFGRLKKGTIIDGRDSMEVMFILSESFYKANPKQFQPLEDIQEEGE